MIKTLFKFSFILTFLLVITLSVAFADEIDINFATASNPSLGNYHVQYLHTGINKDSYKYTK